MFHLHPLAQLRPPRSRRRPLAQAVLEGLVRGQVPLSLEN
jgi:hypothetical protein